MSGLIAFFVTAAALFGPMGQDQPARQPQLAVKGSTVALAFGAGHSIYFSRSLNSGKDFSTPVLVAENGSMLLGRHRGPRIAFSGSTIVVTAVAGQTPPDGNLIAWRSTDGGNTWSKGHVVNDTPAAAIEGLHGLAADSKGRLFAAWLDKRTKGTKLYGARSDDGGLTWSANVLVYASPDGTICTCCHPSIAFDQHGNVLVMWRNALAGSRDMYLSRSADGIAFSTPEKLGQGTWKLDVCPMDGGGVATSTHGVITAWRRDHSLYIDRPGDPEVTIGDGIDVSIAAAKDGTYAIWTTPDGLEFLTPDQTTARSLGVKGAFPNVAALTGSGAIAAWEDQGKIVVWRLPAAD